MKRALVSVTNKEGIVEFCKELQTLGFEIVSTGGTLKKLKEEGVEAIAIDDVTKFPEMLDGRVKTLHPFVHGGLLFRRDLESHVKTVEEYGIKPIDLVMECFERIEANNELNAFITLDKERAIERAKSLEDKEIENMDLYELHDYYYELENNPLLADTMPVFHPTDSVALRSLHERDASGKILKKLSSASSLLFTFPLKSLPFTARDKETTCAMSFPELPSPVQKIYAGKKFLPHVPLQQVTKPYRKNEIIFLFVFLTEEPFTRFISKIQELQEFKYLNYLQRVETDSFYAGLFAAKAEEVTLSPEEMATLEEETQGRVRFRMLKNLNYANRLKHIKHNFNTFRKVTYLYYHICI